MNRRYMLLLTGALTVSAAERLATVPTYTTTARIYQADPVERRIWARGVKPEQFYFSFITRYNIAGRPVSAAVWWRTPKIGKVLEVKAVNRVAFWWATAANLKETP